MAVELETPVADRPWLSQYDAGVPPSLAPYPPRTPVDVVHETANERTDHPALIFKGARVSYGDLDRDTDALARTLKSRGVQPGDRVALLMPNSPQAVIAQFGAWKAGAIVAPLNPLYTEHELERALNECGAETILWRPPLAIQPSVSREATARPSGSMAAVVRRSIRYQVSISPLPLIGIVPLGSHTNSSPISS